MNLRECLILLPGHGLDDFPRSLPNDQADQLLAGWCALWHPQLIATCRTAPRWQQATYPPVELNDLLIVVPSISAGVLRTGFADEVAKAGGLIREAQAPWRQFQGDLLAATGLTNSNPLVEKLKTDFAALGYAFLQIQLMTRQLRYTSNLDELLFNDQVLQAAEAAVAEDAETAERMLQSCFDQLGQERDHYYSLEVNLIDVTLLAGTTLGTTLQAALQKQLDAQAPPTSLVACASLLAKLNTAKPDNMQLLRTALQERVCTLMGGLDHERPHPLMTAEAIRRDLQRARIAYPSLGVTSPRVFTRYSFGAVPDMPLHLRRSGFAGAVLVPWENGAYPLGSQAKISWEASDGTFLPALTPKLLDAASPSSFLTLGWLAGEALEHEHVPAIVLAHWPNRYCDYFEFLQRIASRTPALGKWVLVDDFFDNTDQSYHQERLASSQFRHRWLNASAAPLPLSQLQTTAFYHRLHVRANAAQNIANALFQLDNYHQVTASGDTESTATETQTAAYRAAELCDWAPQLSQLWERIDGLWDMEGELVQPTETLQAIDQLASEQLHRLAKHLVRGSTIATDPQAAHARLVFNPYNCATRVPVHSTHLQSIATDSSWVHAAGRVGNDRVTLVDVPQFGFVLANIKPDHSPPKIKQRPLAETNSLLLNEFLEVQVDPQRGHLRSLHVPGKRGNRFSFSVTRREVREKTHHHSEMHADSVEMLSSSNVFGLIRARGNLVDAGNRVGKFEIDYEIWRGSRIVEITVRLHDLSELLADPWRSAYVLRFAWPTDSAIVRVVEAGARESVGSGSVVSPEMIEIDETDYRTQILTSGLAFHRRVESRFLETILAVNGQAEVTHRFGIAVDLPYPQHTASQFMDCFYDVPLMLTKPVADTSGWIYNVDVKNARLDLESPLLNAHGKLVGQRLRVVETDGKVANAKIRLPREALEAYRVDNLGGRLGKLTTNGDCCTIALRSNERVLVDVLWKA
jgi:alpha-mannosidase